MHAAIGSFLSFSPFKDRLGLYAGLSNRHHTAPHPCIMMSMVIPQDLARSSAIPR